MKRFKQVGALVVCLLICLTLCSCKELDEMRARHVVRQIDGSLLFNGQVYKALPGFYRELNLVTDYNAQLSITEPDVPVLLSRLMSHSYSWSLGDGVVIETNDGGEVVYYCREDLYETYYAAIEADEPLTKLFYDYYDPDTKENKMYILSDEEYNAIWSAYKEGEKRDWSQVSTCYSIALNYCTADTLFRQQSLYVEYSDDAYYLWDEYLVEVPREYKAIFDKIVEKDQMLYT